MDRTAAPEAGGRPLQRVRARAHVCTLRPDPACAAPRRASRRVWVRHAVHGWAEAEVIQQLEGGRVRLRLPDGANFTAAGGDVRPKNSAGLDAPAALEGLEHIDEPNVLHAIRARFKAGRFYTWADHVVVSTAAAAPTSGGQTPPTEFPPGAEVPLTKKLLTRMSTRTEPQTVLVSGVGAVGGWGAVGGESAKAAAATALCQSLASASQDAADQGPAASAPSLPERIRLARIVMEAFLGVDEGGQRGVMAACCTTTFEFLEMQSEWKMTNAAVSASFIDCSRCMLLPAPADATEGVVDPCPLRKANFRVMAQLIAASRAGVDPDLTCRVSPQTQSLDFANDATDLEGWHTTLRGLRDLGVGGEDVTCIMHLASLVLSLAAIELPAEQQQAGAIEDENCAEDQSAAQNAESDATTTLSRAVAQAFGVTVAGVTGDGQEALTAVLDLLASSPSSVDASLAAAVDAVLATTCLVANAPGQAARVVSLRGGVVANGADKGGAGEADHNGIARHASAVETAQARLTALGVQIYQRLVDCVVARVNHSLRSCTLSAYAGCAGSRAIHVFVAQDPTRPAEVPQGGTSSRDEVGGDDMCGPLADAPRRVGGGWNGAASAEPGSGLADLLVGLVNDLIVQRMQDLGRNLEAECVKQGFPCPADAAKVDKGTCCLRIALALPCCCCASSSASLCAAQVSAANRPHTSSYTYVTSSYTCQKTRQTPHRQH